MDAALLATAFEIDQDTVRAKMRAGEITSLCEAGVDEDAGRFRLTFRHQARALRLILDANGAVVSKARYPVTPRSDVPPMGDARR